MKIAFKRACLLIITNSILVQQTYADLELIDFEPPEFSRNSHVGISPNDQWVMSGGSASVIRLGEGAGASQALRIFRGDGNNSFLTRYLESRTKSPVIFIDFKIKPTMEREGGAACFQANGSNISFIARKDDSKAAIWAYDGADRADGKRPEWIETSTSIPYSKNGLLASNFTRLTLRQDYEKKVWDLYVNGRMVAANLGFVDHSPSFDYLRFFASRRGDTLIDDLSVTPKSPLFEDQDQNGIPDDWKSYSNTWRILLDRDSINPATLTSLLSDYTNSSFNREESSTTLILSDSSGAVGKRQKSMASKNSLSVVKFQVFTPLR